jgi:hypothetical protein
MIKNLFKTLIKPFYSPDCLLYDETIEILDYPIPDKALERLPETLDRDERRILYALQCQFNSGTQTFCCRPLVELVFGCMEQEEKEGYLSGVRNSLRAMKPMPNVATLLFNNTDAGNDAITTAVKQDQTRDAQIEELMDRFDDVMVRSLSSFSLRRYTYK